MQVWLDSAAASCCVFRLRVLCQAAGRCAQLLRDVPQGPGLPAYLAWCPWSVHCLGGSPALRGPKPRARVWLSSWVTPPVDGPPGPGGLGEGKGAARCWPWAKRRGCGLTGRAGPGKRRGCRPGPAKEPAGRWRGAGLLPLDPAWTGHLQGPRACVHRGGAGLLTTRAPPQARGRGCWSLACLGPCCAPCLSPFLAWTLAGSRPSPPLLRWCQAPWWGVGFLAVVAPLPAPLSPGRILLPAVAAAASLPSGGSELPRRHFHLLTRNPRSRPWAHMGRGLWGRSLAPLSRRRWLC